MSVWKTTAVSGCHGAGQALHDLRGIYVLWQEMTLDEYEKMMEEKRANLNKPAAPKPTSSDEKAFEGMKAYTRKVRNVSGQHTGCTCKASLYLLELTVGSVTRVLQMFRTWTRLTTWRMSWS